MAGGTLTESSQMLCPHGGSVTAVASGTASAQGGRILTMADSFVIAGCTFQVSGAPSPCVQVVWVVPDARARVGGVPTVSEGSVGLCFAATGVPQGPVQVVSVQSAVSST
jgi:hypothetical protein